MFVFIENWSHNSVTIELTLLLVNYKSIDNKNHFFYKLFICFTKNWNHNFLALELALSPMSCKFVGYKNHVRHAKIVIIKKFNRKTKRRKGSHHLALQLSSRPLSGICHSVYQPWSQSFAAHHWSSTIISFVFTVTKFVVNCTNK